MGENAQIRNAYYDQKINFEGLLQVMINRNNLCWKNSGPYSVSLFIFSILGFWGCFCRQLLFTDEQFLSFTDNAPLIFCFELIFGFETMPESIFLINLISSWYNIPALVTFLIIKHIYIFSCLNSLTDSFNQLQ